jgi:hypothetical protein
MPCEEENNKNQSAARGAIAATVNRSPTGAIPLFSMRFK